MSTHPDGPRDRGLRAGLLWGLPAAVVVGGVVYLQASGDDAMPDASATPASRSEHEDAKDAYLAEVTAASSTGDAPNVLLVYYDDLGYGDVGFMGDTPIATPHMDALAEDGVVLTSFHAPSAVCTPSRAALLTGRLAPRAGVPDVLFPSESPYADLNTSAGLGQDEVTMSEILQAAGYDTAMIGKWHLGDTEGSLPNDFGFASFLGSLYSNDMSPFALYRDGDVVEEEVDQAGLDGLYTDEAVAFIDEAAATDEPFFLYFAHNFPHEPLHAAAENEGRSDAGTYGDVVEGLDDGIGEMVAELEATGQLDNTILIITSDNGPWYQGSTGGVRGRKGEVYEGGMRVPFLVHWPEGVEGGRTLDAMAMGTDILPTLLEWIGIEAPSDRVLDGSSMAGLLAGTSEQVGEFYYFYAGEQLLAVSDGRYKYYREQPYVDVSSGTADVSVTEQGPWLFDLSVDPDESYDVLARYPEVGAALAAELERRDAEMAENPRGWS
ncbi:sulfatase family protein [Demequina gelatinilytica]|uniref:sulfatase family protein n=1 Tax=Demequina gelatinilytica TaxID=1638980 RepID=UPI000782BAD0|nr:sulfatase [Demequina gelatinilytica]